MNIRLNNYNNRARATAVDHFVNAYGTYKPDDEARLLAEEMD